MKLESKIFTYFYITSTILFILYELLFSVFDIDEIIKFLYVFFIIVESINFIYKKYKYFINDWKKIGVIKYKIRGISFFLFFIVIFISIFPLIDYFENGKDLRFTDFFIHIIFLTTLFTYNCHLVIKQEYLTIIEDNRFKDFSKNEIEYIRIKNNYLSIAVFENDKVYNFPIEDFKNDDLSTLNKFIKIENFENTI
jgi:hypothetical protein